MKKNIMMQKFNIIFEDSDLLIVSKPAGLLSVPIKSSKAVNLKDQLNRYLASRKQKAFIVHRIDRYTSGLMVFAKNIRARTHLVNQFLAHKPKRIYLALVRGCMSPPKGKLQHYLKLIKSGFRQVVVKGESQGGQLAVTHYEVLKSNKKYSLVKIQLETGLKNQIRVQFAAAGHPVIGDRHYTPDEKTEPLIQRQALHAYRLGFIHPVTLKQVVFKANPPFDFNN
ncbi:MAG: hypothetical protein A2161_02995, partial [Candidatus Schekmanbacteria bacterium RBG_13_48_7]